MSLLALVTVAVMRTCGRAAAGHDAAAGYRKAGNRQAEQSALDLDPRAGTALVWGPSARGEGEACSGPCSRAAGALIVIGMRLLHRGTGALPITRRHAEV